MGGFGIGRTGKQKNVVPIDGSGFRMTPTGLKVTGKPTYQEWVTTGKTLGQVQTGVQFSLGDWLILGETLYPDRYEQAIESTGLDAQTLMNYAWVARAIPEKRRRPGLTFSHHAAVAGRPEPVQDVLLEQAARDGWSVDRTAQESRRVAMEEPPPAGPAAADLLCDVCFEKLAALPKRELMQIVNQLARGLK